MFRSLLGFDLDFSGAGDTAQRLNEPCSRQTLRASKSIFTEQKEAVEAAASMPWRSSWPAPCCALPCMAQTTTGILLSITTPDKVKSTIGALEFKDGAPSKETVAKAYDYLDLMHGVETFVNAYQGASVAAISRAWRMPACRTTRP